jgi:hypothetical protein
MTPGNPLEPNFLGIGAQKAGSTWLSEILRTHPQVFMAHGKEIDYFSGLYDRGEEWYLGHFRGSSGAAAIGEYSVSYLLDSPEPARRVHAFNPRMKLIAVVRDPVKRAYSHYKWMLQKGLKLPTFTEAIEMEPGLIHRGLYYRNLSHFWELFPDEQIHIIRFDDVEASPDIVQRNLYRFLNVSEDFVSPYTTQIVGKTINPRLQWMESLRRWAYKTCKDRGFAFLITWIKTTGLSDLYRSFNDRSQLPKKLQPEEYQRIYSYFEEDIHKLNRRTGIDVSSWQPGF